MDEQDTAYRFQVACIHDESRMEDELLSIVDQGGSVEDVMVSIRYMVFVGWKIAAEFPL